MIHTIVSWDCCFRNFHHLIDGLLNQDFPRDSYELIFVEQRTREASDACNHRHGLASLGDRLEQAKGRMNFQVAYLDDPPTTAYHLGRCNNAGVEIARGRYISVMDGDQLLPPDFLARLTQAFEADAKGVLSVYRKMASYPVGVKKFEDWMQATNSFRGCLAACPDRFIKVPHVINNFGPMVSASRELWAATGGYDPASVWSTFLSTSGADVAGRLALAAGGKPRYLPGTFAVHPWHPVAVHALRKDGRGKQFLDLQRELTRYSLDNRLPHHRDRTDLLERLHAKNWELIEGIVNMTDVIEDLQMQMPSRSLLAEKLRCWGTQVRGLAR